MRLFVSILAVYVPFDSWRDTAARNQEAQHRNTDTQVESTGHTQKGYLSAGQNRRNGERGCTGERRTGAMESDVISGVQVKGGGMFIYRAL